MPEDVMKQTLNYWMPAQKMGKDGCIVKFYTAHEPVAFPVVKLYEGKSLHNPSEPDLSNLPPNLLKEIQGAGIEPKQGDIEREDALEQDKLHPIEPAIEVYVKLDGEKVTKRVHWEKTLELWAGRASGASDASGASGEQHVYLGLTEEDAALVSLIEDEVTVLAKAALNVVDKVLVSEEDVRVQPDELFSRIFYQLTYTFKNVRGATTVPVSQALSDVGPVDYNSILEGDMSTFAEDIAAGHFAIVSAEAARKMISQLDIKITQVHQESPELRAEVASKVWLYADLITRWKKSPQDAKRFVNDEESIPW